MPSQLERFYKSEFEDLSISLRSYSPHDLKEIHNIISRVRHKLKAD